MKETAVEWLVEELTLIEPPKWVQKAVKKAKTMEKQQIVDFAYVIADDLARGKYRDKKHMEERYNEFLTYREEDDDI